MLTLGYRNAVLHHGYDWPPDRLAKFAKQIEDEKWQEWFRPCRKSSSIKEAEDPFFWMSDEFVQRLLEAIPELAAFLQTAAESLDKRVHGS